MPMEASLYIAALLAFLLGVAHSVLGERYILIRLFRRPDLPRLFGSSAFTTRTLRFAWHITTVAWWGFAAIVFLVARNQASPPSLLVVIGTVFLVSAIIAAAGSRFQHLSWLVLASIASIAFFAASRL
jgi:hypothetical protein